MDTRIATKTAAEGNWYHLDITDFVNSKKANQLKITNGLRAVGKTAVLSDCLFIAKDMEVAVISNAEADKMRSNAPAAAGKTACQRRYAAA